MQTEGIGVELKTNDRWGWSLFRGGVNTVTVLRRQVHVNLYTFGQPQVYTALEGDPAAGLERSPIP